MIEIYNRTSYLLFTLDIPNLSGGELKSAIKIKLNSLFPGNIEERNVKIIKNGSKKWSYLVFVLNKETGSTMLPLSPLFVQHRFSKQTVNALFIDKSWLDYTCLENGAIKSSTVKIRNEDSLLDDVKNFYNKETGLTIYCDKKDKIFFESISDYENIVFFDINEELSKTDVHKISLYSEKSPVVKLKRIGAAAVLLILMVTGTILMHEHQKMENERNALLRIEQERLEQERITRQQELKKLEELKTQYYEIISTKTTTPFDISAIISDCAGAQTRINSATFNGNFFQIEGIAANSLELLRKFEEHRLVRNARLHQVHPSNNRDTFSLSGTVLVEAVIIDNDILSISEQIFILENLIGEETDEETMKYPLSPSSFGQAINALFRKWGCTVNSYQFMNEPYRTEVEYSIRGSGNGFFNALYEIKTRNRAWDVHLTQIRNLYPRNLLDIVVRIRTEYHPLDTENATFAPASTESAVPVPVASISRNYFPPAPTAPRNPAAREQPVVVQLPSRIERVAWLEFIGSIRDHNDNNFIYIKNTRTGDVVRLVQSNEGNMRYNLSSSGSFIAYIDDNIYEINRR
ncbi:MAG: hypothetical protein LBU88_06960 [Treponema sp.]|jgi:hypothetical protein|nr:hypothetical protein [Treponema sp.]